jgi:hypothetical protein
MSIGAVVEQRDWEESPATKADLQLFRADLIALVKDVEGKVKDLRVEMVNMGRDVKKTFGRQICVLEGKVDRRIGVLEEKVDRQTTEVAKLRVSMAWMTMGVVTVLGGLITLFEFLA